MRRTSRSELVRAMRSRLAALSLTSPRMPEESRPSAPRMEVSGVRSSWLTVEMNSSLSRSRALRWLMSRKLSTEPEKRPWSRIGVKRVFGGEGAAVEPEDVVFSGGRGLAARWRGAVAQSSVHAQVGRRGAVQQVVHRLAGERSCRRAQQAGGGGIGKADQAVAVHAADAVGDRVEQNLLLAVEFLGPAAFLGAGQHLPQRSGRGLNGGHGFAVFAQPEVAVELQDRQNLVAHAHRHRPAGDHLLAQGGLDAGTGGTEVRSAIQTARPSFQARPGSSAPLARVSPMLSWIRVSARRPGAPQAVENSSRFSFCVHLPFDGQIPSLGDAKRLEDAHGGNFGGRALAHDLAHHELQRQAMFALLLLGHVAQQAAHGQRIAGLLPLAQAQFELQDAAVGGVVAQRGALHRLAVQGAAKERGHLGAATRPKEIFKRIQRQQRRLVQAKASLPCGIGIQEAPRRAQRGNHLAGVLKQVAIALLRLAQVLLLVQGGGLVHGHGHQAGDCAGVHRGERRCAA